jgi:hypothetical protein
MQTQGETSRVGSSRPVGTVVDRRSTYLRLVHLSTNLVLGRSARGVRRPEPSRQQQEAPWLVKPEGKLARALASRSMVATMGS